MRKVADCRRLPSEMGCNLTLSGDEEEVVQAVVDHLVATHGQSDSADLRLRIREHLVDADEHLPELEHLAESWDSAEASLY